MAAASTNNRSMHPPLDLLRIMFESQKGEWTITSSDGFSFKFHQAIIPEQIPHFRTIFAHKETVEFKEKRIQVPADLEMNKHDLQAFLRYVYYQDKNAMFNSFRTTCAMIRAGHYYDIPELVEFAYNLMAQKRRSNRTWYNTDEMWKLYNHVHLWEETHPLKRRLLEEIARAMKWIFAITKDSEKLLVVTGGDCALRDMMVDISKLNQF